MPGLRLFEVRLTHDWNRLSPQGLSIGDFGRTSQKRYQSDVWHFTSVSLAAGDAGQSLMFCRRRRPAV
jgi:hypothetical protein